MNILYQSIRANLITQRFTRIEELIDELPLEEWVDIWKVQKVVAEAKMSNSSKLIMRDYTRTAAYFNVEMGDIIRLIPPITGKPGHRIRNRDALDSRVFTLHKMILLLDKHLSYTNEQYNSLSEDDRRRACLMAVDDLFRKFEGKDKPVVG